MAAKAAYELERYPRAEQLLNNWLEQSKDEEAVLMLGEVYSNTNQTAKEQALWDKYLALLKSDEARLEILSRQFKMEVKNREYQKALDLWEQMPPTSSPELLYLRAEALKATGKKEEADKIVDGILDRNPGFEQALFWRASDIYTKAEEWYQSEMGKYNKKPDYTSYVYLRRELKKISELFRQSREMFEALRVIDPTNTTYIKYLKNIYLRLEMKEDAVKMDMLLSSQN
jgi:tetratricopeptide (TPR) repeat protein